MNRQRPTLARLRRMARALGIPPRSVPAPQVYRMVLHLLAQQEGK